MKFCRAISSILAFFVAAMLVACGGGSHGGGGNNPISVALSGTVPTSLTENATASLTATVTNDSAAKGVTWSCAPSGACGSFNPTATASAAATTYTAPAAAGSVTVTATSVTDTTKSASATITITAPTGPTLSDGSYVFSLFGMNVAPEPYSVAGVFTVKSGAITGGEQDFVACCQNATDLINPTGSSLSTTASGNLQITLTLCSGTDCTKTDTTVGVSGVETLAGAMMASGTSGRIIEFDLSAASSGTIDLQAATIPAPAGSYAFAVQGVNSASTPAPLAIGGVIAISGSSISTTGSIFDLNNNGTTFTDQTFSSGTVGTPDASGRVVLSLVPSSTSIPAGIGFAGYIIDATHMRLVEVVDPLGGATGGTALGQNSAGLSVSGNSYVLGLTGYDGNGVLQAAGVFAFASGATGVSGNISYSDLAGGAVASPITGGTYVADSTIPGRVTITGLTDGKINTNVEVYVDGNGNALTVGLDAGDVLEGVGYQQTGGGSFAASSFSGTYVMDATGADSVNELELDAVGPISADGSSKVTAPASTAFDLNALSQSAPVSNLAVSGTFTAASSGVFTPGTLTGLDVTTSTNSDTFVYYVVDTTRVIAIEADPNQLTLAYLAQ